MNLDLTRVLDCGKSILPVPAVEQPGGADRSEPERQSNGAIQAVADFDAPLPDDFWAGRQ